MEVECVTFFILCSWVSVTFNPSLLLFRCINWFHFCRVVFSIFFTLNLVLWVEGSSAAVPFTTLLALIALWYVSQHLCVYCAEITSWRLPVSSGYSQNQKINKKTKKIFQNQHHLHFCHVCLKPFNSHGCLFQSVAPPTSHSLITRLIIITM